MQPRETKSSRRERERERVSGANSTTARAACMTEPLAGEREAAAAEHSGAAPQQGNQKHHLVNTIACALVNMSARLQTGFLFLSLVCGPRKLTLLIGDCCLSLCFQICWPACKQQHQQAYRKTSRGLRLHSHSQINCGNFCNDKHLLCAH